MDRFLELLHGSLLILGILNMMTSVNIQTYISVAYIYTLDFSDPTLLTEPRNYLLSVFFPGFMSSPSLCLNRYGFPLHIPLEYDYQL